MTSCLASSSNIGSSKNLLMETSSLRPCGERRGRGGRGGKERGGEEKGDGGQEERGGEEERREKRMEEREGRELVTNRLDHGRTECG